MIPWVGRFVDCKIRIFRIDRAQHVKLQQDRSPGRTSFKQCNAVEGKKKPQKVCLVYSKSVYCQWRSHRKARSKICFALMAHSCREDQSIDLLQGHESNSMDFHLDIKLETSQKKIKPWTKRLTAVRHASIHTWAIRWLKRRLCLKLFLSLQSNFHKSPCFCRSQ